MLKLFGVLLCAGALASADSNTDSLINKVQARYNGAQTLSVQFSETYTMLGRERKPETGTLVLRKQGKMRWDYSHPDGKLFVSDGKNVFLYTPGDNRVEKLPIKDTEDMRAPLAFLLGHLDMKKEFGGFTVRDAGPDEWLDASAKSDRVPYKSVQMRIAPDGEIRALTVVGRDESQLSFAFTDEKINPPVPDRLFHFTIPPGAEVVDSVEFKAQER